MQDMTYYQYKIWYCRPPFGARFSAAQFCQVSLSRVATCRLLVGCCGISLVELMDEWESDTYWRIFRRAFGAVRRRLVFFWSVRGTPLSYHESRPDGTGGQEVEGLMPAAANVQQQGEWLGTPCLLTSEQECRRVAWREEDTKRKKGHERREKRKKNGRREGGKHFLGER